MAVELLSYPSDIDWLAVQNAALRTRRSHSDVSPSSLLRLKYLCSEHSPIRGLNYRWVWHDQKSWVAMHIRTHTVGISQFISSQRNDIQDKYDRNKAPQDSPSSMSAMPMLKPLLLSLRQESVSMPLKRRGTIGQNGLRYYGLSSPN